MSLTDQIQAKLNTPSKEDPSMGVWFDGKTEEDSWVKITRELNTDSGTLTKDGKWIPAPDPSAYTYIDILGDQEGQGEFTDITALKKKFNRLKINLPDGRYRLSANHPTKAKYYIKTWKDDPWVTMSGETAGKRIKMKGDSEATWREWETLDLNVPEADRPRTPAKSIPSNVKKKLIERYENARANIKNKTVGQGQAQIEWDGELYTMIKDSRYKDGYQFKSTKVANQNAFIRRMRQAGKWIDLDTRFGFMKEYFTEKYPNFVIPDDEIMSLAEDIQLDIEENFTTLRNQATQEGLHLDDVFPVSGKEFGFSGRNQFMPIPGQENIEKGAKMAQFPVDESGLHYGNFAHLGSTPKEQVMFDMSSPLYKGRQLSGGLKSKFIKRAILGTISTTAAAFASPLKTLAAIPDVVPVTYLADGLDLGLTSLDLWATKQLPDDHIFKSGATKQEAVDFLTESRVLSAAGALPEPITGTVSSGLGAIHAQTDPRETEEQKRERSERAIGNVRTMMQHGMTPWF